MRILHVVGTRPNFMKAASVIRAGISRIAAGSSSRNYRLRRYSGGNDIPGRPLPDSPREYGATSNSRTWNQSAGWHRHGVAGTRSGGNPLESRQERDRAPAVGRTGWGTNRPTFGFSGSLESMWHTCCLGTSPLQPAYSFSRAAPGLELGRLLHDGPGNSVLYCSFMIWGSRD